MARLTPARAVSATAVIAVVVLAQVGLVLAPSQMNEHPLLVLALRPTPAFLVLIGDAVPRPVAVVVAAVGRTLVDIAYFAVARYGALPLTQRFGLGKGVARGLSSKRTTRGLLSVLFFWSSTPVIVALGLGPTSFLTFLLVTGAGNVVTSWIYVFLGEQLSVHLDPVNSWVAARGMQLTLTLAAAVMVSYFVALRRGRSN